jgi:hypothetical protein
MYYIIRFATSYPIPNGWNTFSHTTYYILILSRYSDLSGEIIARQFENGTNEEIISKGRPHAEKDRIHPATKQRTKTHGVIDAANVTSFYSVGTLSLRVK